MTNKLPQASLLPGALPADEHRALWRRSIAPYFDAQPVGEPTATQILPEIHTFHLGKAIFIDSLFPAHRFVRDKRWMAAYDDVDHVALQLFAKGRNSVANGKRNYVEQGGNIFAVNLAYQVDAVSDESRAMSLILPRSLLAAEIPGFADFRGAVFPEHSVGARIFVDHMISLRNHLPGARAEEASAILQGTLGLVAPLVSQGDIESDSAKGASFAVLCRYIESRLGDFDLETGQICRQFRCSRATIYRMFKPHGGLWKYIQRRRLIRCFRAIASPSTRHRRIYDIALDFGFASPSHFSNMFHSHFGMTPRQVRDAGFAWPKDDGGPPPPGDTIENSAELMWHWAKMLASRAEG